MVRRHHSESAVGLDLGIQNANPPSHYASPPLRRCCAMARCPLLVTGTDTSLFPLLLRHEDVR